MMDHGSVRNLEQIQEQDDPSRTPRGTTVALVVLGGACVVFATLALAGNKSAPAAVPADPLGALVAQAARANGARGSSPPNPAGKATDLSARDVTFPAILSDEISPTTALAAVRTGGAASSPPAVDERHVTSPPPPTDRLSVVPLPAQNVLEATPVITRPRDALTKAATDSAQITTPPPASSAAGHDGGYQLQISSFRAQGDATQFADQLRARGHKAYVLEAHVAGRGTWYRVRVGPFASQHSAAAYRAGFETKEHVVPFIVPPPAPNASVEKVGKPNP